MSIWYVFSDENMTLRTHHPLSKKPPKLTIVSVAEITRPYPVPNAGTPPHQEQ
jgi:hypothetical protein